MNQKTKTFNPAHPGTVLLEEFVKPNGLTQYRLAKDLKVPQTRISQIVKGRRSITANTALRLAHYFNTDAEFWMTLQLQYDLAVTRDESERLIQMEVTPFSDDFQSV